MTNNSTPGGMTNAVAPTAERVIDGDTYAVMLDLNPIATSLLVDLAHALHQSKSTWRLRCIALLRPGTAEHTDQLVALTAHPDVQAALRPLLHPAGAADLSGALYDAKDEPSTCRSYQHECANYAEGADGLCPEHQARAEGNSGVRWA